MRQPGDTISLSLALFCSRQSSDLQYLPLNYTKQRRREQPRIMRCVGDDRRRRASDTRFVRDFEGDYYWPRERERQRFEVFLWTAEMCLAVLEIGRYRIEE